jgi:hypothetical protein
MSDQILVSERVLETQSLIEKKRKVTCTWNEFMWFRTDQWQFVVFHNERSVYTVTAAAL